MSIVHTVQQGEHLPGIAARYGFLDYRHVWNDPANAALKDQRKSPNVLAPGDEVTIPEVTPKSVPAATEKLHRFRAKAAPVLLRLVILDASGEPVPDAEGDLHLDGSRTRIKTDGDGRIEVPIPA